MKGLLVVLCALVTLLALFAGGCAVFVSGVAVLGRGAEARGLLTVSLPALGAAAGVMGVNVALIAALSRGKAPRRTPLFVLLAVVDLAAAAFLAAAIRGDGDFLATAVLPAALAVKGGLTLLLPGRDRLPPPLPESR